MRGARDFTFNIEGCPSHHIDNSMNYGTMECSREIREDGVDEIIRSEKREDDNRSLETRYRDVEIWGCRDIEM